MVGISNNTNSPDPIAPNNNAAAPVSTLNTSIPTKNGADELDAKWIRWRCLVCNYMYEGATTLKECPRCKNADPDKFDDVD